MSSPEASSSPKRIAVVGGGMSGLAAAYEATQLFPTAELRLLEASSRLGGAVHTVHAEELLIEQGADSFITKTPAALELCQELGLADRLIPTNTEHRRALIVCRGELVPVPEGFVLMRANCPEAVIQSAILSEAGKERFLREGQIARAERADDSHWDESVASFATRRLGREAYERLVQPLMAGIYVADAQKLSLAATMPDFLHAERDHGSLAASVVVAKEDAVAQADLTSSGARYGAFLTLPGGMSQLIEALHAALPSEAVRLNRHVMALRPAGKQWLIDSQGVEETFDLVVLATPAYRSADLVLAFDQPLAARLRQIEFASSAVVALAYPAEQLERPLDGFGFVAPAVENRQLLAGSFSTVKFPGRAPEGVAVVRCFLGGALQPELLSLADDELLEIVRHELHELLGASGDPLHVNIARWNQAMPQYHVGHLQLISDIEKQTSNHPGLALAGNAYRGVGVPHCIANGRSAMQAAAASWIASGTH